MNATTDGLGPPYATDSGNPQGGDAYIFVVGFFGVVVLLISLTYTSYFFKRSRSQPPPSISFGTTANSSHIIRLSCGIDEDVLITFPTFLYSNKGDTVTDSSCSICLVDYNPADVVRLLPACGHLYHVSCIDTWLKAHPTCPMCRNTPGPAVPVTSSLEV